MNEVKPGFKSTEFWIKIAGLVVMVALAVVPTLVGVPSWILPALGIVAAYLGVDNYDARRNKLKLQATAPTPVDPQ